MVNHVVWNDSFRVGNKVIDDQHQRLFEFVDKLYLLIESDANFDDSVMEKIILECAEYVLFHFSSEEQMMREIDYAEMESHTELHHAFNTYVSVLIEEFTSGKKIDVVSLYSYVSNWLVEHIVSEDKKLAEGIEQFSKNG